MHAIDSNAHFSRRGTLLKLWSPRVPNAKCQNACGHCLLPLSIAIAYCYRLLLSLIAITYCHHLLLSPIATLARQSPSNGVKSLPDRWILTVAAAKSKVLAKSLPLVDSISTANPDTRGDLLQFRRFRWFAWNSFRGLVSRLRSGAVRIFTHKK